MLRSLFSGVSGLRGHQTMMDVVGNNIANINTTGYKSSQAVFEDTLSQMLKSSGAPQGTAGGSNPAQVGLGMKLAGITTNFSQGATQLTGRATDLAIQGDGFFIVKSGNEQLYTRAGAFSYDSNGTLTTPDGAVVQGWPAVNGVVNSNATPTDLKLPLGTALAPVQTTKSVLGGNLSASATTGTAVTASITMYDAQGTEDPVAMTMTKTGANAWSLSLSDHTGTLGTTNLTFDASGNLSSPNPVSMNVNGQAVSLDVSGLTQFGGASSAAALSQDGSAQGSLQTFTISPDGTLEGVFSNGLKQPLGQVALATFTNPNGLEKVGDTEYRSGVNSGNAQVGTADSGGKGTLASGVLEMSNVDLSQEFTNLIIAQRGFQANAKVITASDEILNDLVNLKR